VTGVRTRWRTGGGWRVWADRRPHVPPRPGVIPPPPRSGRYGWRQVDEAADPGVLRTGRSEWRIVMTRLRKVAVGIRKGRLPAA